MSLLNQTFLVPTVRDGDKAHHDPILWDQLIEKMTESFGGFTTFITGADGYWRDPIKGIVYDRCAICMVAIPGDGESVKKFLEIISWVKVAFDQQTIFSFSSVCELL